MAAAISVLVWPVWPIIRCSLHTSVVESYWRPTSTQLKFQRVRWLSLQVIKYWVGRLDPLPAHRYNNYLTHCAFHGLFWEYVKSNCRFPFTSYLTALFIYCLYGFSAGGLTWSVNESHLLDTKMPNSIWSSLIRSISTSYKVLLIRAIHRY